MERFEKASKIVFCAAPANHPDWGEHTKYKTQCNKQHIFLDFGGTNNWDTPDTTRSVTNTKTQTNKLCSIIMQHKVQPNATEVRSTEQ